MSGRQSAGKVLATPSATPEGTRRITPVGPIALPPPPPRPTLTTQEALLVRVHEKEVELSQRPGPNPNPVALLEVMAQEQMRLTRKVAELEKKQTERTKLARRSFDWLRGIAVMLASVGAFAPFAALMWGEWLKFHPEVAGTLGAGIVTTVLGALTLAARQRRAERRREAEADEDPESVALIHERDSVGP